MRADITDMMQRLRGDKVSSTENKQTQNPFAAAMPSGSGMQLFEELLTDSEKAAMSKTAHDKIFVAPPIPMDDDRLDRDLAQLEKAAHESDEAAVAALMQVLPSYKPNRDMLAG